MASMMLRHADRAWDIHWMHIELQRCRTLTGMEKSNFRGETCVALFKSLEHLPIESSFCKANTLIIESATKCTTSSAVIMKQILHRCLISRDASCVKCSKLGVYRASNFCQEMTPLVQGSVIVIMGVCGSGKSTIGNLLAEAMNCTFLDADDFHPVSNKEKMRKGFPLSEEDRMPWLQDINNALKLFITAGNSVILACSALQKNYREILRSSDPNYMSGGHGSWVKFVLLNVSYEVLAGRLNNRMEKGEHFMPPSLLQSQLELLDIDASEDILQVDATQSPANVVGTIRDLLNESITS